MPSKELEEKRKKEMEERNRQHWSFTQKLPEGGGAEVVTKEVEWRTLIKGSKSRVVVLFAAKWCPPSRFFRHQFDEKAATSSTQLRVVDIDVEETAGIARRFGVVCTPVLLYLIGGEERGRLEGTSPIYSPERSRGARATGNASARRVRRRDARYTGPLQSSRTVEFSAGARGASRGTSRRRPLVTQVPLRRRLFFFSDDGNPT